MLEYKKATLKIIDMHCTSCAMNIDMTLEDLAGVHSVSTKYATSTTQLVYDPQEISLEEIVIRVRDLGYTAQEG